MFGMLKKFKMSGALSAAQNIAGMGESHVDLRTEMLEKDSLYYEFPMLAIDYPPCNKFFENAILHAFQRSGFKIKSRSFFVNSDPTSSMQIPFEGTVSGEEYFVPKDYPVLRILGILTLPLFGLGLIFLFMLKKKQRHTASKASVSYWGINQYSITPISSFMQASGVGADTVKLDSNGSPSIKVDLSADSIEKLTHLHPIRTIMHIAAGIEVKPFQYESEQVVEDKFQTLINKIQDELALQPIAYSKISNSSEISAPTIFKWMATGETLRDIQDRFPF